jgi:hypothetical protein
MRAADRAIAEEYYREPGQPLTAAEAIAAR